MKEKCNIIYKKIKKNLKKYFSTNILFLSYVILSVIIGLSLRFYTVGKAFTIKPLICDLTLVVIIGAFGYLIKPKNQFKYFFAWMTLFTFLAILNNVYYMFYNSFVSVNLLNAIPMLSTVGDSVIVKLRPYHFIFLIALFIFIFIHKKLCKKNYYFEVGRLEKGKKMYFNTFIVGIISMLLILLTLSNIEKSRFIKQWNREYIVQRFGIYTYTFNDLIQSLQPKVSSMFGYDEAVRTYREFYKNKDYSKVKNKYTNIFKGKNVIFIHGESVQNFLINLKVNDIEITPNLNKLAKKGIYFSKFYPQVSVGTSSDTEFTLTTGLLPSINSTIFNNYFDRDYEAMPELFKDLGYYTFAMHGNNGDFWNRNNMYKTLGYDYFYSKSSYEVPKDKSDPNFVVLGLSDKSFFKQSVEKLVKIKKEHEKFMGLMITLSNHSPFNDLTKYPPLDFSMTVKKETGKIDNKGNPIYEDVVVPYLENTDMGNYLKSAHYADEAIGDLLKLVEENNLEDTVFILYGDHEAKLGKKAFNILYNYDPMTNDIKDKDDPTFVNVDSYFYDLLKNTPLLIWTNDDSIAREVTDVMGMYDVLPTVANMFGFDIHYALGNDIFSNHEKIVIFPNGNFLTNKVYYNNFKDEYISLTDEPIEREYIDRLEKYSDERLEVSKAIWTHDLIRKVGNVFEEEK